jgi:hypothetical protein
MQNIKTLATFTFTAPLCFHGSWGFRDAGQHESTMRLYSWGWADKIRFGIEWDIPDLDAFEDIGICTEVGPDGVLSLEGYDGIMALPAQATALLRAWGIRVDDPDTEPSPDVQKAATAAVEASRAAAT